MGCWNIATAAGTGSYQNRGEVPPSGPPGVRQRVPHGSGAIRTPRAFGAVVVASCVVALATVIW